jgi:hypothetical protein
MTGSNVSGEWEKYYMAGKYMTIANLFLNNFLKKQSYL